ncbi:type II secretion system protein GspC [Chromatocurvus halotolerans]|uniref:Type II secretion system protein C (GspC) n=1 Tax=Chromatocurvus halotolerans TaxID=1132028 RepID=A0A4R2KTR0_9GAMM|nr:type II secretion system protein GspC [Chromatocurvus halotolerans]TCO76167.1 type II secretion system protein C (GspC) [Chromatocurvus halotolerans]
MVQGWRDRLGASGEALSRLLESAMARLSQAPALHRLQRLVVLLAALWCTLSLVSIAWSWMPSPQMSVPPLGTIINPLRQSVSAAPAASVDIDRVAGWHLFGDPDSASEEALAQLEARRVAALGDRAGIEDEARESRLPLLLRGVVSSSDDGLGYAMIEHRGEQAVYAVGDDLPVPGRVRLAKVLPSRAVIDNAGSYELLLLFEESALSRQADNRSRGRGAADTAAPPASPRTQQVERPALAAQYRDRLYSDPQSLAEVVQVAPVRSGGDLVGYRLSPGRASDDFTALGFEAGDVVTSVNGLSLSDPANTLRLYQAMRDERSAVFELQRNGSELVLSVQLPDNGKGE